MGDADAEEAFLLIQASVAAINPELPKDERLPPMRCMTALSLGTADGDICAVINRPVRLVSDALVDLLFHPGAMALPKPLATSSTCSPITWRQN